MVGVAVSHHSGGLLATMLNVFNFRILGRPCDPLVGVHDELLAGRGVVVPVCAGLAKHKDYVQNKVIYFTTIT